MERENLQTCEVDGTSFLQELGDVPPCSMYADPRPSVPQISAIEGTASSDGFKYSAEGLTGAAIRYPGRIADPRERAHWCPDSTTSVGVQHTLQIHGPQPSHWTADSCLSESTSLNLRGQKFGSQTSQALMDWQGSCTQSVPCVASHVPKYTVNNSEVAFSPAHTYSNVANFTQNCSNVASTVPQMCSVRLDDNGPTLCAPTLLQNQCDYTGPPQKPDSVDETPNEGLYQAQHTYRYLPNANTSMVARSNNLSATSQTSPSDALHQVSSRSYQEAFISKTSDDFRATPVIPDSYDRPLQQLNRMVSSSSKAKDVTKGSTSEYNLTKPAPTISSVSGPSCNIQEVRKHFIQGNTQSPCRSTTSSVTECNEPSTSVVCPLVLTSTKNGQRGMTATVATLDTSEPVNSSSDWSNFPPQGEIGSYPKTSTFHPFHSGVSTVHYRQNSADQSVRQLNMIAASVDYQTGETLYQRPAEMKPHDNNAQQCSQGAHITQAIADKRGNQSCQMYNKPGTAMHNLPTKPCTSMSPQGVNSPSTSSHTRSEEMKCNGIALAENSPYLPILPKIPGVPLIPKDSSTESPKKRQPMDRATRNERRRQQRLRKKQEALLSQSGSNVSPIGEAQNVQKPSKRFRSKVQRKDEDVKDDSSAIINRSLQSESVEISGFVNLEDSSSTPPKRTPKSSKRLRLPERGPDAKRARQTKQRELRPKIDTLSVKSPSTQIEASLPEGSQNKEISAGFDKQVKMGKPRPPRPKKKRPLPTLIRKKKRSNFYGDDSESEPDVSDRLIGRSTETPVESKRRSERTAGDRKRYTVDLDLNLSDDSDVGNDEMVDLNPVGNSVFTDESKFRVVESILGRRVTKRVVKKVVSKREISVDSQSNPNDGAAVDQDAEEEDEEDVEEFYLKYKGYSYLHCEWRSLDEIDDPRIRPKLRRFEIKQSTMTQGEDDDVLLFNPDYVEVERVLDMKIYRNGVLLTSETHRSQDGNKDSVKLKQSSKRERERSRARALREARAKARAEAEAAFAASNIPSVTSSSSGTQDELSVHDKTEKSAICPTPSASSMTELATVDEKESSSENHTPTDSLSVKNVLDSRRSLSVKGNGSDSTSTQGSDSGTSVNYEKKISLTKSHTDPQITDSGDESQQEERPSSPVTVTYYLVKWRSLAYEDATWELAQDVDPAKVKEFLRWREPPKLDPASRDSNYKIIRPDPSTWEPIKADKLYKNGNKLRDYQLEGVNWLTYCWFHHRNCILADEMGLGKTVQSVTFLLELTKAGLHGPFLVIVPLSTVTNWQREFENWSDFNVVIYHGSSTSRNMIQEYEIFYKRRPSDTSFRHDVYKFHALVTTFEVLMTDIEFFGRIHWAAAIIDEAHRLKNKKCKLGEGLRYLDLDHRVLLTGTPLQNNVEELFGLLNFLEPERFNCSSTFVAEYGDLKTEEQVENLKTLLKPMMLRRLKEDVEKSLAPKEETIVEVELTNIQKKYYRAIMERNFAFLCKGSSSTNVPNLMNVMMELRKCCNHPFLIKGAEDAILADMREQNSSKDSVSEEFQTFQALVYASGKLVLIHKLLPKLRADGHKVLIFSQMIRVLDILEDYLLHQRFPFERIDGRIQGPLRQEAIDRFTADPDKFVFLLCTKAGGLGINLTAADVVIIYDSDWNPQNDLQAQARCHRIGQQKMVKVYRLITRNTYEREMFDRASLKLGLDKAVLQSMGSKEARQAQLSKKEIEELLKKGAYGALMDDDKAGEDFCEEDIDKILQSRARVVQLEQGEKNSTFSKATFSISDNRSDIAIDDPNFWQKWAKKAGVDENTDAMKDLIMKTPRQRRQTNRYSALSNEPVVPSPPSYDISDLDDSANAFSSADENANCSTTGRSRSRRSRRHRRHSRYTTATRRASQTSVAANPDNSLETPRLVEPLDRADLFRVERCLLTWPWGNLTRGLTIIPFKHAMEPDELKYFASAVLAYALRFLPPSADPRVKATIAELTARGVWNLELPELAKRVSIATKRALLSLKSVDVIACAPPLINTESVNFKSSPEFNAKKSIKTDSSLFDETANEEQSHATLTIATKEEEVTTSTNDEPLGSLAVDVQSDLTNLNPVVVTTSDSAHSTVRDTKDLKTENDKSTPDRDISGKMTSERSGFELTISPKSASFDPDALIPFESFRKHVQRGSARLLNRVAFLFFLQCEVVGVEKSTDFIAGHLTHIDFTELAAALPPLEAIDADLPVPWWDRCCDKCLLLGVLKHGWEKYSFMRLDPSLCFWPRAVAMVTEKPKDEITQLSPSKQHSSTDTHISPDDDGNRSQPKNVNDLPHFDDISDQKSMKEDDSVVDELHETKMNEVDNEPLPDELNAEVLHNSVLTETPFPTVADLNSRIRKLVGFFLRVKNHRDLDHVTKGQATEDSENRFTPPPTILRCTERKTVKWTRREEADFYRVVSSFGVEFQPLEPLDTKSNSPVERLYHWHSFRQLANLNRKSDEALTDYFHSFYRMCQRVCKRPLTEFSGSASSSATTTTSGRSAPGEEVCVDPISEERATRCLSRIDLLARIRNDILPHPQLTERLKLCQRGSEVPGWWIPGKHDGELLRASAKHGLARTDLNILTDTEFSFARVIALIRDRLSREAVVADYPGDLNGNRSNIAAVAAAAARAAADQLISEDAINASETGTTAVLTAEIQSEEPDDDDKSHCPTPFASSAPSDDGPAESEAISETLARKHDDVVESAVEGSKENVVLPKNVPSKHDPEEDGPWKTQDDFSTGIQGSNPLGSSDSIANEWSVKFATNLATAWPKDRTIQHRLELVCQAIEQNEWPAPRRYIPTPAAASIPLSDSNRALIESRIINFSTQSTVRGVPIHFSVGTTLQNRIPSSSGYPRVLDRQSPELRSFLAENAKPKDSLPVISLSSLPGNAAEILSTVGPSRGMSDASLAPDECISRLNSLEQPKVVSPTKQILVESDSSNQSKSASANDSPSSYSKVHRSSAPSMDICDVAEYPATSKASATPSRGRGRGRGRGHRVSAIASGRGLVRARQSVSRRGTHVSGTRSISPSKSSNQGETDFVAPTPLSPHRQSIRGRKRKMDGAGRSTDLTTFRNTKKQDPVEPHLTGSVNLRTRSSKTEVQDSSDSDVWSVRVPVISLVDGSLIYGEKAPRRKSLEAWLEANPNYMPYSVEVEDRDIYSRVASARGQDIHNMEALAYKHYLNSLIASATAGMQLPNAINQISSPIPSTSVQTNKSNMVTQQQQYLQLQQQQLLTALSAYARHPAYASLVASALASWQSSGFPISSTGLLPPVTDGAATMVTSVQATNQPLISSTDGSVSSRTRSIATLSCTSSNSASTSQPLRTKTDITSSTSVPSETLSATDTVPTTNHCNTTVVSTNMDAILTAAYKQATANLAYMYNPMAAVAAYSQMLLASSGNPLISDLTGSTQSTLTGQQQATLASMYANYVLASKQQQPAQWDQQRHQQEQFNALASAVASVCSGSNALDPTTLMNILGSSKPDSLITSTRASDASNPDFTSAILVPDHAPSASCSTTVSSKISKSKSEENSDSAVTAPPEPSDVSNKPSTSQTKQEGDSPNTKELNPSSEPPAEDMDHTSAILDLSK